MLLITPEERVALQLLAEGKRTGDITGVCLAALFGRMGAASGVQAVEAALRRGLIVIPHPDSAEARAGHGTTTSQFGLTGSRT